MEEVTLADKVFVMDKGKIVMQGTPREVFSKVEELKSYRLRYRRLLCWRMTETGRCADTGGNIDKRGTGE